MYSKRKLNIGMTETTEHVKGMRNSSFNICSVSYEKLVIKENEKAFSLTLNIALPQGIFYTVFTGGEFIYRDIATGGVG